MNTNLKIVVGLGAFALTIFGATVISNYTDGGSPVKDKPKDKGPEPVVAVETIEPVRYRLTQIYYNPQSEERAQREFPGYFEVNDQEHSVTYWLQNVNPLPVEVSAVSRSCSACTNVRLAVFPPRPRAPEIEAAGQALLGAAGAQAVFPAELEHRLRTYPAADWKLLDFDQPETHQSIPAAGADGTPTWIALQLNFKVRQRGAKLLEATLGFKTANQTTKMTTVFKVGFIGMPRFDITPGLVDFREMGENTPSKTEEIIYSSATVPQQDLPPPKCSEPPGEPFLTFSEPQALSAKELEGLAARLSKPETPARVLGGYRFTVTLHRKNPHPKPGSPPELDIGPLDKAFTVFAANGADTDNPAVRVKATVTGLVALTNGGSIDLGSFHARDGTAKVYSLRSDRLDLALEVASELTEPKVLRAELAATEIEGGRRYWSLKVKIDGGATTSDLPSDSVVVLRDKGTGQLVRLPVKGRSFLR